MTSNSDFASVKIWVPEGSLGSGMFPEEAVQALALGPQAIALDAGSTDSGASYLAEGKSKNSRGAVKADLELIMGAREKAKIPMLIGTAGQAGGDKNVDWTLDVIMEVAREKNYKPKIAVLYSEQSPELLKKKLQEGKIQNLPPLGDLNESLIDRCLHIVALMGPEPYFEALEAGADIIVGGRCSDPAVIAAFALWKGAPAGPAWHAGKVSECGGQATSGASGRRGVFIEIHKDGFDIQPVCPNEKATINGISGHLLYENKDPWKLTEPGGELDVTESEYIQLDDRTVRVTGSVWHPKPYTMKLEGAAGDHYQTIMMIGVADPNVLADPDAFHDRMVDKLNERALAAEGAVKGEFSMSFRFYGWNALTGVKPPKDTPKPTEIGIMCVISAKTQEIASQIAKTCNPWFFHIPLRDGMEMPSYGLIFSPADVDRGLAYEFILNHVVHVENPLELVRMKILGSDAIREKGNIDA
jgi:hypothetical protein